MTNTNKKISLLFNMLRIRMVEEKIADLYPEWEMRCPTHLCIGQEAVAAGVCANLLKEDYVLSTHRSHGHYLAKGGNLDAMIAEIYGKESGCSNGKGGSMHLVDRSAGFLGATPIVGSSIPIAVGAAFGAMMKDESRIAVAFFGDGATETGVFHESLNFAKLKNVPVVFVCENNLYSVYSPLFVRQPEGREIFRLAEAHGVESFQANGNDVLRVDELAGYAVQKAKQGGGPTFLEFKTYRWREHCGPFYDNDIGYRTEAEFEEWRDRCPIEKLKNELLQAKMMFPQDIEKMTEKINDEIEKAVISAKVSPFPEKNLLLKHIYAF